MAHVRATSRATMQETNRHPFRDEKWLFVHNGEVHAVDGICRELLMRIAPELFAHILGTTDAVLVTSEARGRTCELPRVQRRRRETRRRLRDTSRMLRRTPLPPPHLGVGAQALGGATMPMSARAVL